MGKNLFVNKKKNHKEIERISRQCGLKLNPSEKIENVSNWMKLRIEIAKALYKNSDIIIIDEPASFLLPDELSELMMLLKFLASSGKSIVLLTNKINGIIQYTNRVSVIKGGEVVYSDLTLEKSETELVKLAYGEELEIEITKPDIIPEESIYNFDDIYIPKQGEMESDITNINFGVQKGEIFGIIGTNVEELRALLEVINGTKHAHEGRIIANGNDVTDCDQKELRINKVVHIYEDVIRNSIIEELSIAENLIYGYHDNHIFSNEGILDLVAVKQHCNNIIDKFKIKIKDIKNKATGLSEEDKKKLNFAKEVYIDPNVIIVSNIEPEVGFYKLEFIHKRLIELRQNKNAVLLVSIDVDEIMALCDRIAIIRKGNIIHIKEIKELSKEEMIRLLLTGL
jgi:simple sugar transport system ATP-binding protein